MHTHNTLNKAIKFANWAHRGQTRKMTGTPFVGHPFHVMILLLTHGVTLDHLGYIDIIVAGVLHDTLEDNPEEVTFALIEKEFGNGVATIVKNVTLDPTNPDKNLSREKILTCGWETQIVKVADILSNTMNTIDEILEFGFIETQKRFKQPIPKRIKMERDFLNAILVKDGVQHPLSQIKESALTALSRLEIASTFKT